MEFCFFRFNKFPFSLIIFLLGFAEVTGAQPMVHISARPSWLSTYKPYNQKPSLRTVEDGYFFALTEHQVHIEKQANYHHYIREIVSETGIQNGSEIKVSFDPTFERLDFHEITIWRDGKPQSRLKASAFKVVAEEKDLSNFIYQGTYSALCILDDIRKGDRIEYSYTITGSNPIFHNKYSAFLYLQWGETVAHQYTSVIFSPQRKLNMKLFNNAAKPVITDVNGLKRYEWESFQVKPAPYDENEPGWYDARQFVQVSDYSSWAAVSDWALGINPAKTNLKGELAEQVAKIKASSGDDKEKYFRNAVKLVQDEVRYMGIEIGQYSHKANDPEKVFNQRYGDCKDKSLLLVSILRAGGVDANMVFVDSDGGDLDRFLPADNIFDHAVVVAQLNGKPVWVDATMSYQRGTGANIYFPNYGKGLILKPGNTALTPIPQTKTGKTICAENYTVKDEKSPVKFEVITTYTLNEADNIRGRLASSGMADIEKNYLKYYSKIYNNIQSTDSVVVTDDEQKNVLTTIEKYKITDFFKRDSVSGKYTVDLYADFIKYELPQITSQTKTPITVTYPFDEDYTINVVLPGGGDITTEHNAKKRDYYTFTNDYASKGDTISLNYKFAYLQSFIPLDKLNEFRQDIKELVDNDLSYAIDYTPGTNYPSEISPVRTSNLNQWMLNLALLVTLAAGIAGFLIYRIETPGILFSFGSTFVPIGGWLVVVAIFLFCTPFAIVYRLVVDNDFGVNTWQSYSGLANGAAYKITLTFEVVSDVILICYAIFCLILLLSKRDIFPKAIVGYFLATVLFAIIDFSLAEFYIGKEVTSFNLTIGVRTLIFAGIGIAYFLRSERVKETFIVPYPSYNYSYEPPPGKDAA